MKRALLLFGVLQLFCCRKVVVGELTKEDLSVDYLGSKLFLEQSYSEIASLTQSIGHWKDIERNKITDRGSLFVIEKLIYPGLKVALSYKRVESIESSDNRVKTIRGISVGMTEGNVQRLYGKAYETNYIGDKKELLYKLDGDGFLIDAYLISFEIKRGHVDRITMRVDYNEGKILTLED